MVQSITCIARENVGNTNWKKPSIDLKGTFLATYLTGAWSWPGGSSDFPVWTPFRFLAVTMPAYSQPITGITLATIPVITQQSYGEDMPQEERGDPLSSLTMWGFEHMDPSWLRTMPFVSPILPSVILFKTCSFPSSH